MDLTTQLFDRANTRCELCSSEQKLEAYVLPPNDSESVENAVLLCYECQLQLNNPDKLDPNHWHCLNESMWSEHLPVQVLSYRLLDALSSESWARDLKDQMYLDDEALSWAQSSLLVVNEQGAQLSTKDSNGALLVEGDSVTLIKDLDVKGAGFTGR